MKVLVGIVALAAALAAGAGILVDEEQGTEFVCCLVLFGAGVIYGLLAGSKR